MINILFLQVNSLKIFLSYEGKTTRGKSMFKTGILFKDTETVLKNFMTRPGMWHTPLIPEDAGGSLRSKLHSETVSK